MRKELTLKEFYASDPQRAAAPEVPYGRLATSSRCCGPGTASLAGARWSRKHS